MRTIFKYELKAQSFTSLVEPIMMAHDAKYLHVAEQGDSIFIWAEVDTDSTMSKHLFEVYGTGHEMVEDMGVERLHVGSLLVQGGALVFHVYSRKN